MSLRRKVVKNWIGCKFRELKRATRKSLITKKRAHILTKLDENRENPKNFWCEMDINLSVGKSKSKSSHLCDKIRDATGGIVTGLEALNAFNNFYVSVGRDLAAKFPSSPFADLVDIDIRKQCTFRFVGMKEVKFTIRRLNKKLSM